MSAAAWVLVFLVVIVQAVVLVRFDRMLDDLRMLVAHVDRDRRPIVVEPPALPAPLARDEWPGWAWPDRSWRRAAGRDGAAPAGLFDQERG